MSTSVIRSSCGCVAQIHTGTDKKRKGYVFEFDYCPLHDSAHDLYQRLREVETGLSNVTTFRELYIGSLMQANVREALDRAGGVK